jgi:serine/threonine protein kinase
MGIVYCARHVHLDRRVALKLMAPEHAATAEARRRFIRESRTAASINHPKIVTVYDAGDIDGQLYIAMQFIDGSDLRTLCQTEHILAPERLLWMLEQVASALDAAHAHGLVHRDVKPGNVLVDDEKAYLTDFGLTKNRQVAADDSGSVTGEGHFIGTVHYSAPEQITGKDVDYRADVYSLGAMVYECLVGEVPYPRPDSMTTALAHMSDPIPHVTAKRPDLPPAIDGVVAKALSKDKTDRYNSCGEVYDAVDAPSREPPGLRRRRGTAVIGRAIAMRARHRRAPTGVGGGHFQCSGAGAGSLSPY